MRYKILKINDIFILGLKEEELNWDDIDSKLIKQHLFKVQTLSSLFYEFRLLSDSTQIKDTKSKVFRRIQSFGKGKTGWFTFNPIKVRMNSIGKIEKL